MTELTEAEARKLYRINKYPSWHVERYCDGAWFPVVHCDSEETAKKCLDHRIKILLQWSRMSVEDRRRAILRNDAQ